VGLCDAENGRVLGDKGVVEEKGVGGTCGKGAVDVDEEPF